MAFGRVKCGMNIASDPKSIPPSTLLSPEASQAAALASATGILTVDLDAIVANWRKLEKTAVPAEWDVFCRRSGWSGGAAIHIDTGMNRLGLTVTEAQGIVPRINAGDHGITLVMSHLASAELLNNPHNAKQLTAFREIASLFSGVPASLANSSGVFLGPQFQFDLVRPGAALYGINPTPEADNPMQDRK